jgi:NTE family protein
MADPSNPSREDTRFPERNNAPRIGIALGSGGAKGFAHVAMLEALDELGITPHRIAGCSIGAVMGALYASGLSAKQIVEEVERLAITRNDTMRNVLAHRKVRRWMELIDSDFLGGGLVKSEAIMATLTETGLRESFEDLAVPFGVVAADFWEGRAVVLDSGPLKPAVQASMAMPGVFKPVVLAGRVLIDGGTVNPVPYDILMDCCDIVIAVDVNGGSGAEPGSVPGYFDTIFGSIQIMQKAIVAQALATRPPHIYINPHLTDFRTLHFFKAAEIYEHAQAAKQELKQRIEKCVAVWMDARAGETRDSARR